MSLDIKTLETTFDLVAPRGDELMDVFYARLFKAAPAVKPLFNPDRLQSQKAMLLSTLVLVRKSLHNLNAIVPTLRRLGASHVAFGAQPAHYAVVGEVLIASLAEIAGDVWRPEHKAAWKDAYKIIADTMLQGAAEAELKMAA
jgi:methyl-accepting chemotaxis protein